jgi:hypothetical protein
MEQGIVDNPTGATPSAPTPENSVRRFNLNLPDEMYQELVAMATKTNRPMSEVIKTALGLYAVASDEIGKNNQVLIADRDGQPIKQLIFR